MTAEVSDVQEVTAEEQRLMAIISAMPATRRAEQLIDAANPDPDKEFTLPPEAERLFGEVIATPEYQRLQQIRHGATAEPFDVEGPKTIRVDPGEMPAVVDQIEQRIIDAQLPIYQHGPLVRVIKVPLFRAGRQITTTRLAPLQARYLAEEVTRITRFQKYDGRAKRYVTCDCPPNAAETFLQRLEYRLRVLAGLIHAPTLRPNGTLLDKPGYDSQTGLLFDSCDETFPAIPAKPTRSQALGAVLRLKKLLEEFPFVSASDLSVALSLILTGLVRRSLSTAPLHAVTSPTAGTGKSMIVDIATLIATGQRARVISQGASDEELEKRLSALLLEGDTFIAVDNIERPYGGEFQCSALTQTSMKVRILGQSVQAEIPCNAVFTTTGNNLQFLGDMNRRVILCALDAGVERPESRKFKADPLAAIEADRGRYVAAALTILRAYHAAGMPASGKTPLGSFVDWSRWIRDCLLWLGEADPCATMERVRAEDPKLSALSAVMAQWEKAIGDRRIAVKAVVEEANRAASFGEESDGGEFREALFAVAGDGPVVNSRRLGKWLLGVKDRVVAGRKFVKDGEREGVALWRLAPASWPTAV